MSITKLLVANRGEIALRVFRACRALGIATVAVVAPDDKGSLHARSADETVEIASYLFSEEHIRAAKQTGADAIHPGYGFLAENADFAEAVGAAELVWVGPPPEALRAGGDKLEAKRIATEAGVPVVPTGEPEELGLPLIVKAAAGGGGRGMRVVRAAGELEEALAAARREAKAAFGDDRLFCERYVERPRHVEIQVLADSHGDVRSLGERDCSIQRRHQKVLEESPSPAVDESLRAALGEAGVAFARAIGYEGAGTAEFMLDGRERSSSRASTSCRRKCALPRASRSTRVANRAATRSRCACTRRIHARSSRRRAASSACVSQTASASTPASKKATRSASPTTR